MSIPDIQEAINLIEEGKPEAAIPLLAQWAEHMPTYVAVHVVLARAHEARHQWPEALAAWQRAHFLMPNSPAVQEGLQRVLAVSSTETEPPEAEALSMDLDLEAELEATLEALFNPFTLPQQSEDIAIEEAAVLDEDTALTEIEEAPGDEETEPLETIETEDESPVADEAEVVEEAEIVEEAEVAEMADTVEAVEEAVAEAVEIDDAVESVEEAEIEAEIDDAILEEPVEETPVVEEADVAEEVEPVDKKAEDTATLEEVEPLEEKAPIDEADLADEAEAPAEDTEPAEDASLTTAETALAIEEAATETGDADLEAWEEFDEVTDADSVPPQGEGVDDLERLIDELESARIVPHPDLEDLEPPDLEDEIDDMVSETLARIYASQQKYLEAARVYDQLAQQQPEQADTFLQQAAEMRALAAEQGEE